MKTIIIRKLSLSLLIAVVAIIETVLGASAQTLQMKLKDVLFHKIIIALIAIIIPISLYAEDKWIGKWKSVDIQEDTETMTMFLEFNDSTNMTMGFETDNTIPNVGQCISYIYVSGIYSKIGPIFITHIDEQSLNVDIKKLEFDKAFTDKSEAGWVEDLKNSMKKQILTNAKGIFAGYDGGTMIYVTHDDPNEMSFIFGDETNAMDLKFTRINQ